jgi:Ca2+:H+ antiporter
VPAIDDRFFHEAVRPYTFFAAALLFLSYVIGLWFTLRTHAAVIWSTETDEKKAMMQSEHHQSTSADHNNMESSQRENFAIGAIGSLLRHQAASETERPDAQQLLLNKRIAAAQPAAALRVPGGSAGGSMRREMGRANTVAAVPVSAGAAAATTPHIVPPTDNGGGGEHGSKAGSVAGSVLHVPGLSEQESGRLTHEVAEVAAAAARNAVSTALRPSSGHYPRASHIYHSPHHSHHQHQHQQQQSPQQQQQQRGASSAAYDENDDAATVEAAGHDAGGHGHDAPNWGRKKSAVILLGATVLYAIIAEILVNTVDVVLDNVVIDEKFLGITLFALVPNTTEFLVRICGSPLSNSPFHPFEYFEKNSLSKWRHEF